MSPVTPSSTTKEAEVEARIAKIRAKNAALLKRHQEVEEDRRSAESSNAALQTKQASADWNEEEAFRNPFRPETAQRGHSRRQQDAGGAWRSRGAPAAGAGASSSIKQRLGEREGPPKDPVNRFLADSYRDGSENGGGQQQQRGSGLRRPLRGRGGGRGAAHLGQTRQETEQPPQQPAPNGSRAWEGGRGKRRTNDENVSPRRPFGDSKESSPRPGSSRGGGRGASNGTVPRPPRSSVQNRLLKVRGTLDNDENRRVKGYDDKLTVEVTFDRTPETTSPPTQSPVRVKQDLSNADEGQWQDMPSQELEAQEPPAVEVVEDASGTAAHVDQFQRQESNNDWMNTPSIGDWSEEVSKELNSPEAVMLSSPYEWGGGYQQEYPAAAAAAAMAAPQMMSAYYDPHQQAAGYVAYQDPTYLPQMNHHQHQYGAQTQVSPGPHHNAPIMTSQPLLQGVIPQQHQQQHQQQQYYNDTGYHQQQPVGYYSGPPPPIRRNFEQNSGFMESRGRGRWYDREPGTKEVTRIPSKFQKQRLPKTPAATLTRHKLPENLPTTTNTTPASTCDRLTVLSSSDFGQMQSKMSDSLNGFAEVSYIPTPDITSLYKNISKVSPDRDLAVLIHVGASEAAEIAAKGGLSDLEKGAESDKEADAICDLVEDLVKRIPYMKIFVSMLCPRFDLGSEGGGGMKLPNSVRRFMNVQLSTRLGNKKKEGKILLISNDDVLDCFEDDSKRERLFGARGDGVKMTDDGEDLLIDHWIKTLKSVMPATPSDTVESISKEMDKVKVVESDDKFEDAVEAAPQVEESADKDEKSNEAVSDSEDSSSKAEIREKENDEKMEKEL